MQAGQEVNWQFKEGSDANELAMPSFKPIEWTASEYVAHDKTPGWFLVYGLASFGLIAATFLLTREVISVILLAVFAIGVGIFAGRQPETLHYRIDSSGVHIGPKSYPIGMFKAFAVIDEGAIRSISLLPLKRFMPSISIYYAPDDERAIIEALGSLLPHEERQQDAIDRFMHRIRF